MKFIQNLIFVTLFVVGFCLAISDGVLFPLPNFVGIGLVWLSTRLAEKADRYEA